MNGQLHFYKWAVPIVHRLIYLKITLEMANLEAAQGMNEE
jgi:hypothetical protein